MKHADNLLLSGRKLLFFNNMPVIKYREEIDRVFEVLRTPFMSDYTFHEVKVSFGEEYGLTYEQMDKDIEEGVRNGFSPEFQVKMFLDLFSSYSNQVK